MRLGLHEVMPALTTKAAPPCMSTEEESEGPFLPALHIGKFPKWLFELM